MSVAKGRSVCDKCKKQLRWYDNIPLLSFVLLYGKCRDCGKKISVRYPLIELISGLGFVFIGLNLFNLILFLILLFIFITDVEHQIIPDEAVFLGILIAFVQLFIKDTEIYSNLYAGLSAASLLALIYIFSKGRGMGLGDVKFAVLGGLITGKEYVLIWLFLAFFTGAIVGIMLIMNKKAALKDHIAFGPFLIFALLLTEYWGDKIIRLLGY